MTVQATEVLKYGKLNRSMQSEPLEAYFKLVGHRPQFGFMATNNWRGYIGDWEIKDKKLYLTRLNQMGLRKTDTGVLPCLVPNNVTLPEIFPGTTGPVFADWYTGQLRCPEGDVIDYHRGPFGALYERYLVLSVERGVVVSEETVVSIERVNSPVIEETASEQKDRTAKFRAWLKKIV
ncbi:hypothetical protein MWN63_02770 [Paradonghicola geojensis]|nr:hypothetical protein [Marivivens geojensis]